MPASRLSAPLAVSLLRVVLRREGPPLNPALRDTARLHLFYGLLFALSLLAMTLAAPSSGTAIPSATPEAESSPWPTTR